MAHYSAIIMTAMTSQITVQATIKENIKAPRHWPLRGEFTGYRWIPRTKGQQHGKCFYWMTSSCDGISWDMGYFVSGGVLLNRTYKTVWYLLKHCLRWVCKWYTSVTSNFHEICAQFCCVSFVVVTFKVLVRFTQYIHTYSWMLLHSNWQW